MVQHYFVERYGRAVNEERECQLSYLMTDTFFFDEDESLTQFFMDEPFTLYNTLFSIEK
jgi:hypothetical protein